MKKTLLAQADRALAEGDVETAMEALISYAESRGRGEAGADDDLRFDTIVGVAMEMGELEL